MSRTLPSPPTQTLPTPTDTLETTDLETFVINHTRMDIGFLNFFNSLTDDLQYTIEYPSNDGSLPYIDILVNADKSTYVYRKPTHTNLYVHSIPVPFHPPKTVSSGPLLDEPTSYAPPTLTKRTEHSLHNLLTKWTPLTESNASWTASNKN